MKRCIKHIECSPGVGKHCIGIRPFNILQNLSDDSNDINEHHNKDWIVFSVLGKPQMPL